MLLGLQACAINTKPATAETKQDAVLNKARVAKSTSLDEQYQKNAELMYLLLVAEVAAQQGELPTSVQAYLKAARISDDPKIAERATRVASFARDYKSAMLAAERWAELQPTNLDVQHSLVILYLRNKMLDKAVDAVDLVLKMTAKSKIQGFGHLVALLNNEGDKEAVLQLMDRVVSNYSNNPHAHFAYARLAFQSKHYEKAKQKVDQAIKLKPDYDAAWSLLARTQMMQGETDEALAIMRKLVDSNPKSATHRASYARLLAVAKRYDEALKQFRQVLKVTPDNADIIYAIALLNLEQRKFNEAEKYFKSLLDKRKHVFESYYYLGSIAEELKQYSKAIKWYKQVQHGQNKIDAGIRVAQLLAKQKKLNEARNYLHNMHNRDPNLAVRLYVVEIDILSKANEYSTAMEVANRGLAEYADDADLLYARSLLAEKIDRLDMAEADLKKILEKDPKNIHALNALGYTLADRTERLQEAYGYIKQAIALAPEEPAILDSMGWVLYRMGRAREAIDYLRRALKIMPDDEIAAHLGEVLWVSGLKKEATEVWNKALQEYPDSVHLKDVLKRFNP
jgi:tetratricopeptide (TPR) repeat protein